MLSDLRVVVDVQHLYRPEKPLDRGAVYALANGLRTDEATATLIYAQAITQWLRARGAAVLTNDPARGVLVGPYSTRNLFAAGWHAHAYLACHLNSGGGDYGLMEHMTMNHGQGLATLIASRLAGAFPPIVTARARALSGTDRGAVCIREVPAVTATVLCEPFFGDTLSHQPLLAAPQLQRIGWVIAKGVAEWWGAQSSVPVQTATGG
jgi:N-acetylmuramoyl-L-alanine amidase